MKHKLLTIGLPIVGAVALVGIGIASAAGFMGGGSGGTLGFGGFGGGAAIVSPTDAATSQAAQFQAEASATGLSESVIVNGWAQDQSLEQIATANGITGTQLQTDMKNYAQSQLNAELQALVTNGTITQAQMTERLTSLQTEQAAIQAKMTANGGKAGGFGGRGHKSSATSTTSTSTN